MRYLIASKQREKALRSFVLASYKAEKEMLADLTKKARERPLIPIEERIRGRIRELMERDRITSKALMSNKVWNVDGKSIRDLLRDLQFDAAYPYLFGTGSHAVHGDWHDIHQYQLTQEGRYYHPRLRWTDPDPRTACAMTGMCLDALLRYLRWNKADPSNLLSPVVLKLLRMNGMIDSAHEKTLNMKRD